MALDSTLVSILVGQGLLLLTGAAAARVKISSLGRRVRRLEQAEHERSDRFVPRREIESALKRIDDASSSNNSLLRALLAERGLSIRGIEAAAAAGHTLDLAEAIAREEGFGKIGARPTRNCNPGDLEFRPWMERFLGTIEIPPAGVRPRFACFPSMALGFMAMRDLLRSPVYRGLTVRQCLCRWAPPAENDVSAYEANVLAWTGLTPDTVIDGHLGPSVQPSGGASA